VGKTEEKIIEKIIGHEVVLATGFKFSPEGSRPAVLVSAGQAKSKCVG